MTSIPPPKPPPFIVPQATIDYYAKDRKTYEKPPKEEKPKVTNEK